MLPKKTMAMVQTGVRQIEPRDIPLPDIDADSALLQVEACGICGSDYEQYEGQLRTPMPVIPGHEPLGIIAKIGDNAARRWGVDVGDRVVVETMLSCRFCIPCEFTPISRLTTVRGYGAPMPSTCICTRTPSSTRSTRACRLKSQ